MDGRQRLFKDEIKLMVKLVFLIMSEYHDLRFGEKYLAQIFYGKTSEGSLVIIWLEKNTILILKL